MMKKFFAKNLCFCCGIGKESKKKTNVPFVQQVAIHDIVPNSNGNGVVDKPTYTNKAYKEDDGIQTSSNNTSSVYFRTRQLSQLSNISEFFRLPLPDERALGDVVIEEYDQKSRTLHAGESGDLSDHSKATSRAGSTDTYKVVTKHDQSKYRPDTSSNISKSTEQDKFSPSITSQNQSPETTAINTETQTSESHNKAAHTESKSEDDTEKVSDDESVTSLDVSLEEESETVSQSEETYQNKSLAINSEINHINPVPISA